MGWLAAPDALAELDTLALGGVAAVVMAPALMMLLGSVAVLCVTIPGKVQARTQNFSAGLLISAVAGELFPLMSSPEAATGGAAAEGGGGVGYLGLCGGFTLGLLFMFGLECLTEGAEGDEAEEAKGGGGIGLMRRLSSMSLDAPLLVGEEAATVLEAFRAEASDLHSEVCRLEASLQRGSREDIDEVIHLLGYRVDRLKRRLKPPGPLDEANLARMRDHAGELRETCDGLGSHTSVESAREALKALELALNHLHGHAHRTKFRRWNPAPAPPLEQPLSERIPWALVVAVTVDAAVDGLLIGLAFTASESAGWCMSIATCIEMGFLGLSFSASVRNATRSLVKHVTLVTLPPIVLALAGMLGHALGSLLEESPGLFVGFIAFSIVALLFLVTQELLAEARELAGDDMTTNIMFFVGLLGGILLEKALG